jgi:DNA-binding transcriptional ArsR family regulator
VRNGGIFGSDARDRILGVLALLDSSYPRELARILALPLFTVQRAVDDFERLGVLATRVVGRTRLVELNRRWFAAAELRTFLQRIAEADPRFGAVAATVRRRPRRAGKSL